MYKWVEEKVKEWEARENEQKQKNKKRFNNIIQQNQIQKQVEINSSSEDEVRPTQNDSKIPPVVTDPECNVNNPNQGSTEVVEVSETNGSEVMEVGMEDFAPDMQSMVTDEGEFFEVEKVMDKRIYMSEVQYLVKWKNLDHAESTWEPEQNLIYVQHLIDQFNDDFERLMKARLHKKDTKKGKNTRRQKEGAYEVGDQAAKIVNVRKDEENNELVFTIEWHPRDNGSIPMQSNYSNKQLRKLDPHLLLGFYESKLKLVK